MRWLRMLAAFLQSELFNVNLLHMNHVNQHASTGVLIFRLSRLH